MNTWQWAVAAMALYLVWINTTECKQHTFSVSNNIHIDGTAADLLLTEVVVYCNCTAAIM
jgi:hypothetical protein